MNESYLWINKRHWTTFKSKIQHLFIKSPIRLQEKRCYLTMWKCPSLYQSFDELAWGKVFRQKRNNNKSSRCHWINAFYVKILMKSYQMTSGYCLFRSIQWSNKNDIRLKWPKASLGRSLSIWENLFEYVRFVRWGKKPQPNIF